MQRVFELSNLTLLPFWLSMILAPRWRLTERLQRWPIGVLAPTFVYALLVLPRLGEILPVVARPSLPSVAALLGTPAGATIAWAHFLAFDFLVGRWIYLDARQRGYSAWVISPLLLLTLLLGPLGMLGYLTLRAGIPKKIRAIAGRVAEGSGPLVALTLGSLGLLAASLALQLVDPREVLGVSTWVKPAKFGISVALNAATLAMLLRWMQPLTRGMRRVVPVMSALLALELIIIAVQAGRGVPSHFNNATAIDTILFAVMGISIAVFWIGLIYLGWRAFRQRFASPALGLGNPPGLRRRGARVRPRLHHAAPDAGPAGEPRRPATRRPPSARTRSAWRTAGRACPSRAGAPKVATCASPTSSACTGCSCCRCWAGSSGGGRGRARRASR